MLGDNELLYFADPRCSWCWGFAPAAEALAARFADDAPLSVVVGGLHCGTRRPLDARTKAKIREHWEHVHEASGQPFDHAFFERERFVYDTEPSCRGVVAARRICAEGALPMLERLHRAFYAENRDVTDETELVALGAELLGVPEARFREVYEAEETLGETYADFQLARELGVTGFPTLLARKACSMTVVTQGWQPLERIESPLAEWLAEDAAAAAP